MPEIKISEGAKSLVDGTGKGSVIQQASGTLGDIISLVTKGEQLVGHFENIVTMFKGQQPNTQESSIIQSKAPAPPISSNTPQNAPSVPTDDKSMEAYFTSPEGLKKIADAIDKMVPLFGDLKLSEVKKAIMENIAPEKKGKERRKNEIKKEH